MRYLNRNGAHNPIVVCKLSTVGPNAKIPRCLLNVLATFQTEGNNWKACRFLVITFIGGYCDLQNSSLTMRS